LTISGDWASDSLLKKRESAKGKKKEKNLGAIAREACGMEEEGTTM